MKEKNLWEQFGKHNAVKGMAIALLCTFLCGCVQEQATPSEEVPYGSAGVASDMEAAEMLRDISTTQYFTDEAVQQHDMETIVLAGINAPSAMNGQPWHFSVITDPEVLKQIVDDMGGGMAFGGVSEEMTPPEGTFPEGGQGRDEGGRQPGSRGGGMTGAALLIAGTEDAALSAEDILSQIRLAAEELGYQAGGMELTEEQQTAIAVSDGHSVRLVVLISAQMPEMETEETAG